MPPDCGASPSVYQFFNQFIQEGIDQTFLFELLFYTTNWEFDAQFSLFKNATHIINWKNQTAFSNNNPFWKAIPKRDKKNNWLTSCF